MVQSGEVAAESGVVVVRDLIINVVAGHIVVIVLQIRTADQCAPQGVRLRIGFVHALGGGAGGRTMVGMCGIAVLVSHFKGIAHGVVAQDVFHLILCPLSEGQIVCLLGVDHSAQTGSRVVTGAAVVGNNSETGRGLGDPCAVRLRQILDRRGSDLGVPQLVVHAEVLVLGDWIVEVRIGGICLAQTGPEFQVPAENVPVTGDIRHRSKLCEYTAPNGIPAVCPDVLPAVAGVFDDTLHIAGVRVRTHFAGNAFVNADDIVNVVIVFGAVVQPYRCPRQFVIVIAGGVETAVIAQAVYGLGVVAHFVVRLYGEIVQRQGVVQALLRIFRVSVLEVQIVHCQRCGCTGGLVGCRRFGGCEVCRTLDGAGRGGNIGVVYLQFRCAPVVVVVVAFAHLVAVCHYISVVI